MTRWFALIVGIVYLVLGIAGFVPGLVQEETFPDLVVHGPGEGLLLGLFPVNVLHHIVHLLVGILGIAAYRSFDMTRLYSRGLAIFYGVLAVLGLIEAGNLNHLFGLVPIFSHDIWLHAVTAIIAAYFGGGAVDARDEAPGRVV